MPRYKKGYLGIMVILAEPLTSRFTVAGANRDTLPSVEGI
jgi:hypothetical protein